MTERDFDEWWQRRGRLIDPEPLASWEDKRRGLAAAAFAAAKAQSGNYVADDAVEPHKVTFANGRTVEVGADGVLQVGWALAALEEAGR